MDSKQISLDKIDYLNVSLLKTDDELEK